MGIKEPVSQHLDNLYHAGLDKKSRHARAQKEKEILEIEKAVALSEMPKSKRVSKSAQKGKNGGVRTLK